MSLIESHKVIQATMADSKDHGIKLATSISFILAVGPMSYSLNQYFSCLIMLHSDLAFGHTFPYCVIVHSSLSNHGLNV